MPAVLIAGQSWMREWSGAANRAAASGPNPGAPSARRSGALRQAATELSRWLDADYGLTAPGMASLISVSMRYDVADLVGTQVSIVARMPYAALRGVTRRAR